VSVRTGEESVVEVGAIWVMGLAHRMPFTFVDVLTSKYVILCKYSIPLATSRAHFKSCGGRSKG
jgi:hypothetical protein